MSHPDQPAALLQRTAPRALRQSLVPWVLLVLACGYGLCARWHTLQAPPAQTDGVNGLIARNYLKYGFPHLGLAQIVSPGPVLPPEERVYYQTHPPLAPLLGVLGIALLGPTVEALRLPHVLLGLATVALLAWMAGRLYGRSAALWAAWAAAALPIAAAYGSSWPEPLGPALIFFTVLASVLYHRYAEEGGRRGFCLLVAAGVLALASDWPAYIMAFVLAGHALVYRTRASKRAMLALPALALAAFAGLMFYARAIPAKQNLYGSLGGMLSGWTTGEGGEEMQAYSLAGWVANFMIKYVEQFSPLALLALVWALARVPSAFRRENHSDQHLLMLWAWPLAFAVALHRIFFVHVHYHLLFLPAVVVSLGGLGNWLLGGRESRAKLPRALLAAACGVFLILWSHHIAVATEDRLTPLRRQQVAWARELSRTMAPAEEGGFVLHYAMQMRFLADRRLTEDVDTWAKVEALRAAGAKAERLFVPLGQPFGEIGFGARLSGAFPAVLGERLVQFRLDSGEGPGFLSITALVPLELSAGVRVERLEYSLLRAEEGRFLYVGWSAARLPRLRPGETLEWRVRFAGAEGQTVGTASSPANANASCLLPVPPGWQETDGRAEMALVRRSWDVSALSLPRRLLRLALRMGTMGVLDAPKPVETVYGMQGEAPIELPLHPRGTSQEGR